MATIILSATLRELAGSDTIEAAGGTVGAALRELERRCPRLQGWILDEQGLARRHVNLFVNDTRAGLETEVGANDSIYVLPAISGGR